MRRLDYKKGHYKANVFFNFKNLLLKKIIPQLAEWDNNTEIRAQIRNYLKQFNKNFLFTRVVRICEVDAPLFFSVSIENPENLKYLFPLLK